MIKYFKSLDEKIKKLLHKNEEYICSLEAEESSFVRLNENIIRQAGSIKQKYIDLKIFNDKKHAGVTFTLTGDIKEDESKIASLVSRLQKVLKNVENDPFFDVNKEVVSSESVKSNTVSNDDEAVSEIMALGEGVDVVGVYASGKIMNGFMNSFGQFNWSESASFNFDYSMYYENDKAVKGNYAGLNWNSEKFHVSYTNSKKQYKLLKKNQKKLSPGNFRVYIAPSGVMSIMEMLCWGGFSEKQIRTKNSSLLKLFQQKEALHKSITIEERIKGAISPNFQSEGYIKPDVVKLIDNGKYNGGLISPRTAKEYGLKTNGANMSETPVSLYMAPGDIVCDQILNQLETGIYINNLWYLNYSDRSNCRITGMTRFACFWVEHGEIVAPINVIRFDDSIYNMLGKNLIGLTRENDFFMDAGTYECRSTDSMNLPGVLIDEVAFTL